MRRLWPVLAMILAATDSAASEIDSHEALVAFEWFCLERIGDTARVPPLFEAIKIPPLPKDVAKPLLAPLDGDAWFVPGETERFVVTITSNEGCGVTAPYSNGRELQRSFIENFKSIEISRDNEGMQSTFIYAVTYKGQRGLLTISLPKAKGSKGVVLNILPESFARREGLKIDQWPSER